MVKAAIIENGIVTNIAVAVDEATAQARGWVVTETASIGWSYDGETFTPPLPEEPDRAQIDAERDSRIGQGFTFAGKVFDSRPEDQKRISGAATLALGALVNGAQQGNLRWHGGDSDFGWIAQDNSLMAMDAQTVFAFGQAAANWESIHVFAGRALKDMDPIPQDYANDQYWP